MREAFWEEMYELMKSHDDIVVLTSDTGFKVMDKIREEFGGSRCLNIGIAEQNMIGMAAGLANEGYSVWCYAIDPFVNLRPYEQVRDDICIEGRNVKLVGVGAGVDYWPLGSTHHSESRFAVTRVLPNLTIYSPSDEYTARMLAQEAYRLKSPVYISLSRYSEPKAYDNIDMNVEDGIAVARECLNPDITLIATGVFVKVALEVAGLLGDIKTEVLDVYRLKPVPQLLEDSVTYSIAPYMAAIEEHSKTGGLGSLVAELIAESDGHRPRFRRYGMPDRFCRSYGDRDYLMRNMELSAEQIAEKIKVGMEA